MTNTTQAEQTRAQRRHIALVGRCNSGKSSLLNALTQQESALVSPLAGTTTDPIEKTMECAPLGPVVFYDTAGLDDNSPLGQARKERSLRALYQSDLALLVIDGTWTEQDEMLAQRLRRDALPFLIVCNKCDRFSALPHFSETVRAHAPVVFVSAKDGTGLEALRNAMHAALPDEMPQPLLSDLLPPEGLVLFVVPIDSGAPKGRLIMPQVQALRDTLDGARVSVLCTEQQLPVALGRLAQRPDLVVCDSQVIHTVAPLIAEDVPLTTFSILMARAKGDLFLLTQGALALTTLAPHDHVVIQEACSHHAQKDDIGRVKIPRLLQKLAGGPVTTHIIAGKQGVAYPDELRALAPKVIIHCGACALTRTQMQRRLRNAQRIGIPMTNYGMAIALAQGILQRALSPFPRVRALL